MIDFQNAKYIKLRAVSPEKFMKPVGAMLVQGEEIAFCFQGIRDYLIFTDRRLITVNIQGVTGKKQDFTTLPYKRIQTWSVETAGIFDLDSELELWFSGLGKVHLEFTGGTDVAAICRLIGECML
ncbi:MAG: PH domain-containing protein [Clostridia bacterium]|nr:PH domain-containing protein [Clostridia bacterium]